MKILFVCLGNICRSPMAEGAFKHILDQHNRNDFEVDSAGTASYHVGAMADKRMRTTAENHGVYLTSQARQVNTRDFYHFDIIVAMDNNNLEDLELKKPSDATAKLVLMRSYDEENLNADVPDPYYGGQDGFEEVYEILMRSCKTFYESLKNKA